jgi:hypothetical protein
MAILKSMGRSGFSSGVLYVFYGSIENMTKCFTDNNMNSVKSVDLIIDKGRKETYLLTPLPLSCWKEIRILNLW